MRGIWQFILKKRVNSAQKHIKKPARVVNAGKYLIASGGNALAYKVS